MELTIMLIAKLFSHHISYNLNTPIEQNAETFALSGHHKMVARKPTCF